MKVHTIILGMYQTNCYIVELDNHACLIIDPATKAERIIAKISEWNLKPLAILLTHGHFDHIGACDDLYKHYQIPIYAHENEESFLLNSYGDRIAMNVKVHSPIKYIQNAVLTFQDVQVEAIEAFGHSAGSVMYLINEILFSGDVLFKEGIGRTDLESGSDSQMRQSIKFIKTLSPSIVVYPGHGPSTTIEHELQNNPFF